MTTAVLRLYGVIGDTGLTAGDVATFLASVGAADEIEVRINSGGGWIAEGLAIHNLLAAAGKRIRVIIDGVAASMASVIAMVGSEIVIREDAVMMIHEPWRITVGDAVEHRKAVNELTTVSVTMVEIYARRTGQPAAVVKEAMEAETWWNAADAVAWGLATRVEPAAAPERLAALASASFAHLDLRNVPARIAAMLRPDHPTAAADLEESPAMPPEEANPLVITAPDSAAAEAQAAAVQAAAARAAAAAVSAERQRIAAITTMAERVRLPAAMAAKWVEEGLTLEAAQAKAIDAVHEQQQREVPGGMPQPYYASVGHQDESDRAARAEAMAHAIAHRYAPHLVPLKAGERARDYMGWSMTDLAAVHLGLPGRNRMEHARASLHSTSDFPLLLENSLNKILQAQYALVGRNYAAWTAPRTFRDFRPHPELRAGDFPALKLNGENEPIEYGTMSEGKESLSAVKYARRLGLSFEMIVNDDLGAFASLAEMGGQRVADLENQIVYGILTANSGAGQNLRDGNPLFHTSRNNVASVPAAISIASLSIARAAMRKQKSLDGMALNLQPAVLVCGPDKETEAQQVLNQVITPTSDSASNPFKGLIVPVCDANITGNGWYLFARPGQAPTVKAGHLEGYAGPRIETSPGWSTVGVEYRILLFFGAGPVDFRGAFRNAGA